MEKSLIDKIIQCGDWYAVEYRDYYPLSVDFVKKFSDIIGWNNTHRYNKFSDAFILELKDMCY